MIPGKHRLSEDLGEDGSDDASDDGPDFSDHFGHDVDREPVGVSRISLSDIEHSSDDDDAPDFDPGPHDHGDSVDSSSPNQATKQAQITRSRDLKRASATETNFNIGGSFGGTLWYADRSGAVGAGLSVGASIDAEGKGEVALGAFMPTGGRGIALAEVGPALEMGYTSGGFVSTPSRGICVEQSVVVLPAFTVSIATPAPESEGVSFSVSFGFTLGLGLFHGYYCGTAVEVIDVDINMPNP